MKPQHTSQARKFSPIAGIKAAVAVLLSLTWIIAPSTHAQSAANFDTKTLSPEAPVAKEETTAKPVATEAAPAGNTPSRQVGPAELEAYVASLSSVFMSRGRTLDPFGMPQDPDAKPVVKAPSRERSSASPHPGDSVSRDHR